MHDRNSLGRDTAMLYRFFVALSSRQQHAMETANLEERTCT
jgi:hypothetical protein